jgi:hypothetical protein
MRILLALCILLLAGCAITPQNLNPAIWCSLDGHAMVSLQATGLTTTAGAGFGNWLPAADRLCAPLAPTQVALPPVAAASAASGSTK